MLDGKATRRISRTIRIPSVRSASRTPRPRNPAALLAALAALEDEFRTILKHNASSR